MRDYYSYNYKPKKTKEEVALQREKLLKKHPELKPIIVEGKLAKTWWGQAWNRNLESYADYVNRIARGRSYVRSGAVFDLTITPSIVYALVQGTRKKPYEVCIGIDALSPEKWQSIVTKCGRKIENLDDLVLGKFPSELENLFVDIKGGLFPSFHEIHFDCSCPDWAMMCKHVAAALYGIGARFDEDPTLFFLLRGIDFSELLKKTVENKMENMLKNVDQDTSRKIKDEDASELFGL